MSEFPQNPIQFIFFFISCAGNFKKYASKCTTKKIKTSAYTRDYNTIHLLPTGCKIRLHDFFKIVQAGKNLLKVKFTELSIT